MPGPGGDGDGYERSGPRGKIAGGLVGRGNRVVKIRKGGKPDAAIARVWCEICRQHAVPNAGGKVRRNGMANVRTAVALNPALAGRHARDAKKPAMSAGFWTARDRSA